MANGGSWVGVTARMEAVFQSLAQHRSRCCVLSGARGYRRRLVKGRSRLGLAERRKRVLGSTGRSSWGDAVRGGTWKVSGHGVVGAKN